MNILLGLVLILYVLAAAFLVLTILMQEGKGGGLSGLGGSAIGDTFGFSNASTELRKFTRYSAIAFFAIALILTFIGESSIHNAEKEFFKGAQVEETTPEKANDAATTATAEETTATTAAEETTTPAEATTTAPAEAATTATEQAAP
ncbi:preprotein translocase subunit SecG, partial [Candidatus Sumerlaeota bacterium]|nr:preprotein translocase subunit SecG [Candidatus Sumerlaeota bacterium]